MDTQRFQASYFYTVRKRLLIHIYGDLQVVLPEWKDLPPTTHQIWIRFIQLVQDCNRQLFQATQTFCTYTGSDFYMFYKHAVVGTATDVLPNLADFLVLSDEEQRSWNSLAYHYNVCTNKW